MMLDQFVARGHTFLKLAMLIGSFEIPVPDTTAVDKRTQMLTSSPIEAARIGLDVLNSPAFLNHGTADWSQTLADMYIELEGTP